MAWLGGAVFLVKQGYLLGRFYVLILIFFAMAMCASLLSWKANGMLEWVKARQLKWQVGYFLIFLTDSNIPLAFQLNKLAHIATAKNIRMST